MADRMIECPGCKGLRTVRVKAWTSNELWHWTDAVCGPCCGSGTIPDRRKPTANDRAVERIKEWCESPRVAPSLVAATAFARASVLVIIREEADRG